MEEEMGNTSKKFCTFCNLFELPYASYTVEKKKCASLIHHLTSFLSMFRPTYHPEHMQRKSQRLKRQKLDITPPSAPPDSLLSSSSADRPVDSFLLPEGI